MSFDGSEGNYYTLASISWSPDSKHVAAYCVRPGLNAVHYVESSPADQLHQSSAREYKPRRARHRAAGAFDVQTKKQFVIDRACCQPTAFQTGVAQGWPSLHL